MKTIKINPEVFFADGQIAAAGLSDLGFLIEAAQASPRHRARVCAHQDPEETLHEMIVVMTRESYLIPEKHFVKVESYHIIQGQADVVIFDEAGEITEVIEIGDAVSGKPFYFRVRQSDFYHSLVIRTDLLIYHESATGPFRKADTYVAPWAPPEADEPRKLAFMREIEQRVDAFQGARRGVGV